MADLIADTEDLALEKRLRISVLWDSIKVFSHLPKETFAQLQIGAFLGDAALFSDVVYGNPVERKRKELRPGYFRGYDTDCEFLTELKRLVESGGRLDFEDVTEPLFRLIIAPDAFNPDMQETPEVDWYEVLATFQWGGARHGSALGSEGPSVRFKVRRSAVRQFWRDLVAEAMESSTTESAARSILEKRFTEIVPFA